jgi:cobalt-zinc-cadmium efflux system protein
MTGSHTHGTSAGAEHRARLWWALGLTGTYLVAEVVGGLLTGSLALLADAGHMLTDVLGLGMSLFAIHLSSRPTTKEKTFGYYRAEILAALANAVLLVVVAISVLREAYVRFLNPPEILGGWMLGVAVVGLVVNLASLLILYGGAGESLNVKGAYLEVLSDTLGSVGVIVAAVVVLLTGWRQADPLIGVGIGLFILPRAYHLLRESVDILLEGTPGHIDLAEVRAALEELPGVVRVHDLHAWTITSGMYAVSGHLVVEEVTRSWSILGEAHRMLHDRFGLDHSTLQLEPSDFDHVRDTHP